MNSLSYIPFALPDIGEAEISSVVETLKSGWITTGPKVEIFEKNFSEYVGSLFTLSVNSATAGLHLALECVGVTQNDKVITVPYTFTATAEVIRYLGADPIFCDIEPNTRLIDVGKLEEICDELCQGNHNIKAIIPVHIAGQVCDMDRILEIAKKYNLFVIEDAAHSLPATYKEKKVGNIGDITVFSFYATKNITTAEGGMIATNNQTFFERMKLMRLHGINKVSWDRYHTKIPKWQYEIIAPGFKYNLTDIAAAIGIEQLKRADDFQKRRQKIAEYYNQEFKGLSKIQIPQIKHSENVHSWHLYILNINEKEETDNSRNNFIEIMSEFGVGCSVHFIPLHIMPYWKTKYNLKTTDFPISLQEFLKAVSLPIYTRLSDSQIEYITEAVKKTILKIGDS